MQLPDSLHIPVKLQKLQKSNNNINNDNINNTINNDNNNTADTIATVYFPEGSTANEVCESITERNRRRFGFAGIWLLKVKEEEEEDYKDIKDSKYQLMEGKDYTALYYTGPDMFIVK